MKCATINEQRRECPICLQFVEKLKSGSHVIPKWAMKMTKQRGRYVSLVLKKNYEPKAARGQSDLICDFWCETCENRFRDDDANGASFFRDKAHIIREMRPDLKTGNAGIEIHNAEALNNLRSFIIGLFVRYDVYSKKVLGESPLGARFAFYTKIHTAGTFNNENAGLVLIRNSILGASHSSPKKTRFGNRSCVMMVFCGYDVLLISDNRGHEDNDFSKLITSREIVIPVSGGDRLPHVRKFVQTIKKIGSPAQSRSR